MILSCPEASFDFEIVPQHTVTLAGSEATPILLDDTAPSKVVAILTIEKQT